MGVVGKTQDEGGEDASGRRGMGIATHTHTHTQRERETRRHRKTTKNTKTHKNRGTQEHTHTHKETKTESASGWEWPRGRGCRGKREVGGERGWRRKTRCESPRGRTSAPGKAGTDTSRLAETETVWVAVPCKPPHCRESYGAPRRELCSTVADEPEHV